MAESATAEEIEPTDEQSTEAAPELEKATPPSVHRLGLLAEHNNCFRLNVAASVTPDQCMDEGFWAHIAARLNPGDEIHVMPDTMTWELVLHVIGTGRNYAHVCTKVLYNLAAREEQVKLPAAYQIQYKGTTYKWCVIRDGKMIKQGIETEALAKRAGANHEAAIFR